MMKTTPGAVEPESKDFPGPESFIPLSPQWLLSKHGDGKPPMTLIDLSQTPVSSSNGNNGDSDSKEGWRPDSSQDADKRKDWRRTTTTEGDRSAGNRREGWREDERESSLLGRRDRRKEGGDATDRRVDRRAATARDPAESKRTPLSERRSDSTSREINYETRRDSKWNTHWGPEDKVKETPRDKRLDFEKEGEGYRGKQHPSSNRNENDREADMSARDRWRPHSITARSKGEIPPPLSSTPPKIAPGFGIGRGRGDTTSAGFAVGRGRGNLSGINSLHGTFSPIGSPPGVERGDNSDFRYPRAKLLDIYRKCSVSFLDKKNHEGFNEVPQLTQSDPFEPLAFFPPDMDEEAVLEGILKGDVLSSGAIHSTPKEATANKFRENNGWNRARGRGIGNKEEGGYESARGDSSLVVNLALEQDSKPLKTKHADSSNTPSIIIPSLLVKGVKKADDTSVTSFDGLANGDVLGMSSRGETSALTSNSRTTNDELGNQESGASLTRVFTSEGQDGRSGNYDEKIEVLDKLTALHLSRNSEGGNLSLCEGKKHGSNFLISPEELSLFYIDPQGKVQGPFPGVDIIDWFKAGFFGTDLLVRTADSPEGTPFTQLSKVMPHLQLASQAPSAANASIDAMDYQESNDRTMKVAVTSKFLQQGVVDPSLQVGSGRTTPFEGGGYLQAEGGLFSVHGNMDRRKETTNDKNSRQEKPFSAYEEAGMLKRASSLPQRMAGLPHIQNDDLHPLFGQHWHEKGTVLTEKPGLNLRNAGHLSSRAELLHGAPDLFLSPVGSTSLERSWSDLSLAKETLPHHLSSHGLDAFHMHQLRQLEKHRIQQQLELGLPLPHLLLQQQHLRQQQLAEQLLSPGQAHHDLSLHALQQLASPPLPSRLQHQQSFPLQASDSIVDPLLRLHQQQQAPSHAYLEQLLRQHQQLPGIEHLHGSPVLTDRYLRRLQEASRIDIQAQQVEQLLQRHTHELLIQRQQEHQARQHAFLIQQQLSHAHDHRISGVWEVDELGQFVQTQASNPVHPQDFFHQQQLQRHPSFPSMQLAGASPGGVSGLNNSQLRPSRSELRKLADLEMQKNLASLLEGSTSMPSEKLAQLQSEIARFEAQNLSRPENGSFKLQTQKMQNLQSDLELSGEAGGGWNAGRDFDKQANEILNRQAKEMVNKAEDLSKVVSSHASFSGQCGNSSPSSLHEQEVRANLWAGERVPVDSDSSSVQALASCQPLFESAGSLTAEGWDMDWPKADIGLAREFPTEGLSDIPTVSSNELLGVVGEVEASTPSLLHDGVNFVNSNDLRDVIQQSLKDNDQFSAASLVRSGSVKVEGPREALPSTPGHFLGDAQQAREENSSSQMAMWSVDMKNQVKAVNTLKEVQDVPRIMGNELEGVPLSMHQQMQSTSTISFAGNTPAWQRAPSPSLTKSPASLHDSTVMRSATPGDDEFFWIHNNTANGHQNSRGEGYDTQVEQFGTRFSVNDEGLVCQSSTAGASRMPGFSELPGLAFAGIKPMQSIARDLRASKQAEVLSALTPQGSLTIADAKAFREWCEEQINLRRESASDNLRSGPAFEALKAEFLLHKDSMPSEPIHASLSAADNSLRQKQVDVKSDNRTSDQPEKSSEGEEEELDSETSGQNSVLKGAKKAKKGKKIVDPSLLGFSVASNRILMGEIQHVSES